MVLISVVATLVVASARVTKEVVTIDRDTRPYYLFVPDSLYYQRAPAINQQAWDFLKAVVLADEPKYQPYNDAQRRRP